MEKVKRNERVLAMVKILANEPNKIYTLGHFCELFGAAKSSLSEDIDIAREILEKYNLGTLVTVAGAAGGVMYESRTDAQKDQHFILGLCQMLQDPSRVLPGGQLYMLDILNDPAYTARMGEIIAGWYAQSRADFVLTVETKGIPVALMTARTLGVPLVVARREARATDGPVVTINYVSGSARRIQTMSLPRKAASVGQRALIVDDFMKGGGSAVGLYDLMKEFSVEVAGVAVVLAMQEPQTKLVQNYKSLMVLGEVNDYTRTVNVWPSQDIQPR